MLGHEQACLRSTSFSLQQSHGKLRGKIKQKRPFSGPEQTFTVKRDPLYFEEGPRWWGGGIVQQTVTCSWLQDNIKMDLQELGCGGYGLDRAGSG